MTHERCRGGRVKQEKWIGKACCVAGQRSDLVEAPHRFQRSGPEGPTPAVIVNRISFLPSSPTLRPSCLSPSVPQVCVYMCTLVHMLMCAPACGGQRLVLHVFLNCFHLIFETVSHWPCLFSWASWSVSHRDLLVSTSPEQEHKHRHLPHPASVCRSWGAEPEPRVC